MGKLGNRLFNIIDVDQSQWKATNRNDNLKSLIKKAYILRVICGQLGEFSDHRQRGYDFLSRRCRRGSQLMRLKILNELIKNKFTESIFALKRLGDSASYALTSSKYH